MNKKWLLISILGFVLIISACSHQTPKAATNDPLIEAFDSVGIAFKQFSGRVVGNTCVNDVDCGSGENCKAGICEAIPIQQVPQESCTDSDGGKNSDAAGSTTWNMGDGNILNDNDYCEGTSRLVERYCDGTRSNNENIDCGSGKVCQQGACVQSAQPTCTDSDNGQDFKTAGTANYLNTANGQMETSSDSCLGGNNLQEWYCENGNIKSVSYQCTPSEACRNGACVDASVKGACSNHKECAYPNEACVKGTCMALSSLCTETDGGNVDNVKGTLTYIHDVTGEKVTVTDKCIHKTLLGEYECKVYWAKGRRGKEFLMLINNPTSDCATKGGYCQDGACIYTPGAKSAEGGMCATDDHCQQGLKCNRNYGFCESVKIKERGPCQKTEDCEAGLICDSYLCQKVTCVDSDSGANPKDSQGKLTITTTRMGTYDIPDECPVFDGGYVDESMLVEYKCNLNNVLYWEKSLEFCPARSKCVNGACGVPAPEVKYDCTDTEFPKDSANIVREPSVFGSIAYTDGTGQHTQNDECATKTSVKDHYCMFNYAESEVVDCSYGEICRNGACVSKPTPSCSDPDAVGDDVFELKQRYTSGTVIYIDDEGEHKVSDSCSGGTFLNEMLCSENVKTELQIDCKGKCVNGACEKSLESCTDTDGQDVTKVTTVNYVNKNGIKGFFYDSCGPNNQMNEAICNGNIPGSKLIPCPTGTTCQRSGCVKAVVAPAPPKPVYTPPPRRKSRWWRRW